VLAHDDEGLNVEYLQEEDCSTSHGVHKVGTENGEKIVESGDEWPRNFKPVATLALNATSVYLCRLI